MSQFEMTYLLSWIAVTVAVAAIMFRKSEDFSIFHREYWRFLFAKWKVLTFLIACVGITVMGPFTGDPTWDFVTAPMMSILTFATAPWSVGTLYQVLTRKNPLPHGIVTATLWMLSASWSYDLYLLLRDGFYPVTWLANMAASSLLYFAAGLLWNLDWRESRGVTFAFLEENWFLQDRRPDFRKIMGFAAMFIGLGAWMLLPYLF